MKKLVYLLIALLVFGGVAFVLTQTSLLKGAWGGLVGDKNLQEVVTNPDINLDVKTDGDLSIPAGDIKDPMNTDTDGDGLMDQDEVDRGTDSRNPDTDGDGLVDGLEVNLGTDPLNEDTDNGGAKDGDEMSAHKDPLDATDDTADADVDGGTPAADETPAPDSATTDSAYACFELNITPEVYELRRTNEDVAFTVELTVDETSSPTAWDASYFSASTLAFTVIEPLGGTKDDISPTTGEVLIPNTRETPTYEIDTLWEGTLEVKSDGDGEFIDPNTGITARRLEIPVSYYYTEVDLVYTGGDVGDTIYAAIKEETDCQDELPILAKQTQSKTSFACSDVQIIPDTYTLPSGETAMDFEVEVTSKEETDELSWKSFFKNLMALTLILPPQDKAADEWSGNLLVQTDGGGSLSTPASETTGNAVLVEVSGESSTIPFNYEDAVAGETIMASVVGEEKECTDTITLDAEEDVTQTQTTTPDITSTTTDDEEDEPEVVNEEDTEEVATTTTTSNDEGNSNEDEEYTFDEILTSKDYVCTEPFGDVANVDWFFGNFCRLYQGGIVQGYDSTTAGPEKNITRAEALKILLLLAGYEVNDAHGYSESLKDVEEKDWYYPYYILAEKNYIVRPIENGGYANPNQAITRGDFMLTMARIAAATSDGEKGTLYGWDENDIPFSDLSKSDYYTYAIIIGYNTIVDDPDEGETRVFEGYSNGTSGATKYIARSEAVALALRFYLAWYAE